MTAICCCWLSPAMPQISIAKGFTGPVAGPLGSVVSGAGVGPFPPAVLFRQARLAQERLGLLLVEGARLEVRVVGPGAGRLVGDRGHGPPLEELVDDLLLGRGEVERLPDLGHPQEVDVLEVEVAPGHRRVLEHLDVVVPQRLVDPADARRSAICASPVWSWTISVLSSGTIR